MPNLRFKVWTVRFYGCLKNGVNTIYYPGCQRLFMGGFCGFGQVFWPLAWLRPVADTEAASRTREKKTLAQSDLHVYIRTEWRKLLDCRRMPCRPAFYPYKPAVQFCKHSKSFQHPWNSAELSSPVSFTQQPLLWQFGSSSAHVKYGVFISASIFFFAKRSMVSESDAYYTQKSSFFWWRWFLTTHVLYVSGFTHQLFQLLLRCAF